MASELDRLGIERGSPRSSLDADTLRRYEPLVRDWRADAFDLLDIGVADGASLRTWADYFPSARIVGLDVRKVAFPDLPDRCVLMHGDESDLAALHSLLRAHRFRIVIDAGRGDDRDLTFRTLFPAVEPGGFYACEWRTEIPGAGGLGREPEAARRGAAGLDRLQTLLLRIGQRTLRQPDGRGAARRIDPWVERVAPLVGSVTLAHGVCLVTRSEAGR